MREQRHWVVRFLAEIVVGLLLVAAVLSYRFDLGERLLGPGPVDPAADPSAVLPPEGLRLPATRAVPAVARSVPAGKVDPARVADAVRPLLRPRVLGRHYAVLVIDASTGRAVYRRGAPAVVPASTAKLLTSTAALESLGPMARFRTTVRWLPKTRQLVLVGGGDPFLASSARVGKVSYPGRADVQSLAKAVAGKLRSMRVSRVRLAYDDSAFSGPAVNPAWPATYIPEDVVPPISSLWVDEAHDPSGSGFLVDPAAGAVQAFGSALRANGVRTGPRPLRVTTPRSAVEVGSVSSAPLGEIVERTLAVSDNQAAEVLARQVGLAVHKEGSSAVGTAAVLEVIRRLGVPTAGDTLHDGSGLARSDQLRPDSLAGVLGLAVSGKHPELRHVVTGLPVAGFTGSLRYRFDKGPAAARGRVRAKTGTLTGVHGLAGVADDVSGGRMVFVVVADRVGPLKDLEAQTLIDRIAGALGACRCGVGSRP